MSADDDTAVVLVTEFTVTMDREPDNELIQAISWFVEGNVAYGSVIIGNCVGFELGEHTLWSFPVIIVSRSGLDLLVMTTLQRMIQASCGGATGVSTASSMGLNLAGILPPPPEPARRVESRLVREPLDVTKLILALDPLDRTALATGLGFEIVSSDWRKRVLISRDSDQVSVGVRANLDQEPLWLSRGFTWVEFQGLLPNSGNVSLEHLCRMVTEERRDPIFRRDLSSLRQFTGVYLPPEFAPEPEEAKVRTGWTTYGRSQFAADLERGITHWFIRGSGRSDPKLLIIRLEESGKLAYIAIRESSDDRFFFVVWTAARLAKWIAGSKKPVFATLLSVTLSGSETNRDGVMRHTGFTFV